MVAFEENHDPIFAFLRRRVGESDAADLTAETFLVALREFDRFDSKQGTIRSWLFGIASNLMRKKARKEQRELRAFARTGIDPLTVDPMVTVDQRVDAEAVKPQLARGLASLSEEDREAILLFCWADLSYTEIAQALDIPLGTVKSRVARARRKLRKSLERGSLIQNTMIVEEAPDG